MFQEILQAILGIVNVLNISDKLTSINNQKKKNKLAKQLRKLYKSISRSAKYSQQIEDELRRIISIEEDSWDNTPKSLSKYCLPRLGDLLTKQKYELLEFKKIISMWDEDKDTYFPMLLEIYGDDMEYEFNRISTFKYSYIDWVDYYLLKRVGSNNIIIPKTFKLSDIPVFNRTYNSGISFYHMDYEISTNPAIEQEYMTKINFSEIVDEQKAIDIVKQCYSLLNEVIEFNSTQKLLQTKSKLANIIRSNFNIEEVF